MHDVLFVTDKRAASPDLLWAGLPISTRVIRVEVADADDMSVDAAGLSDARPAEPGTLTVVAV